MFEKGSTDIRASRLALTREGVESGSSIAEWYIGPDQQSLKSTYKQDKKMEVYGDLAIGPYNVVYMTVGPNYTLHQYTGYDAVPNMLNKVKNFSEIGESIIPK